MIIAAIATMSSTFGSEQRTIGRVKDDRLCWLRFEGPGKFHNRRWHIARPFPTGGWGTLCGLVVHVAQIEDAPGEGPRCVACEAAATRQIGFL